jgi:chromosome segregation ATPase
LLLSNQNSERESLIAKLNQSIESLNLSNSNQIVTINDKNEEIKFLQEQRKQIDEDISELEKELVSTQGKLFVLVLFLNFSFRLILII